MERKKNEGRGRREEGWKGEERKKNEGRGRGKDRRKGDMRKGGRREKQRKRREGRKKKRREDGGRGKETGHSPCLPACTQNSTCRESNHTLGSPRAALVP